MRKLFFFVLLALNCAAQMQPLSTIGTAPPFRGYTNYTNGELWGANRTSSIYDNARWKPTVDVQNLTVQWVMTWSNGSDGVCPGCSGGGECQQYSGAEWSGAAEAHRYSQMACESDGTCYVFGGVCANVNPLDVVRVDSLGLTSTLMTGSPFNSLEAAVGHDPVTDKYILAGGMVYGSPTGRLYTYDKASNSVTLLSTTSNESKVDAPAMFTFQGHLYLFGGATSTPMDISLKEAGASHNLYRWDADHFTLIPSDDGNYPPGTWFPAIVPDEDNSQMVYFWPSSDGNTANNQVWTATLVNNQVHWTNAGISGGPAIQLSPTNYYRQTVNIVRLSAGNFLVTGFDPLNQYRLTKAFLLTVGTIYTPPPPPVRTFEHVVFDSWVETTRVSSSSYLQAITDATANFNKFVVQGSSVETVTGVDSLLDPEKTYFQSH